VEINANIIGPKDANLRSGIASFNIGNINPHDISLMLNAKNIMLRSGMYCVHSWFNANKINGSVRASLYLYNTKEEVEIFMKHIKDIAKLVR